MEKYTLKWPIVEVALKIYEAVQQFIGLGCLST